MTKRVDGILRILAKDGKATVLELAGELGVAPATIRKDLMFLEKGGFLHRVHGGAELTEIDDISHRMSINYNEKLRIARKARELVTENETIFVESGSLNALFVKELADLAGLTIITSNAFVARSIEQQKGCTVVLLGGVFQKESESLVGNLAKVCLENINFSKVFLGIDGFTFDTGFTGRDMMRAEIIEAVVKKGHEIIILSDSSKFGHIGMSRYCSLDDVDIVVTDDQLPQEYRDGLAAKVKLLLA